MKDMAINQDETNCMSAILYIFLLIVDQLFKARLMVTLCSNSYCCKRVGKFALNFGLTKGCFEQLFAVFSHT